MIPQNATAPLDANLTGVWRSIGYNKCFELTSEHFKIYDLSEISCILSKEGLLEDFYKVFDRFERDSTGALYFYARGGITRYGLNPFDIGMMASLQDNKPADPIINFEVFWHYFKENYAFFNLRGIDWGRVYSEYRPQVSARMSDGELAGILTSILRGLNDSHATLDIPGQTIKTRQPHALVRQWQKEFQSEQFLELYPRGIPRLCSALNAEALGGKGKTALNGQLLWGRPEPRIGYLCIFSLMDMYADFDLLHFAGFEVANLAYLQALGHVIDQALTDLADTDGLILDIRFNPGGHDSAGRTIASRFTDRQRLAFTKQVRLQDGFSSPQPISLQPEGTAAYTHPVILLTSEATASAAETLVYYMMALPQVTRLGGKTRGVLSDMLLMQLPNGWVTSISNEIYTVAGGICYEGTGIPAQVEMVAFNPENFYPDLSLAVHMAAGYFKY
jgi:carboxyl-terminal processing protease